MYSDGLYPLLAPAQPVRPFWMGDDQNNERWELIQGDCLCFFIDVLCGAGDCPTPDITGWTWAFTIKASLDINDPNYLLQIFWTSMHGLCGQTALIVQPYLSARIPTGRWAFDVKYRTGSQQFVKTVKRGEIDILPSSNIDISGEYEIPPPTVGPPVSAQVAQARLAT